MAKNMYHRFIGRIFLAVHTRQPPSDEEWDAALSGMGPFLKTSERVCSLIFTDGGAPNTAQRKRLRETYAGRDIPVAVLSGALIPRFVNASIALFNKSIRSYTPEEFPLARTYLQITDPEMELIREALLQIQKQMLPEKVVALERALQN